MTLSEANLRLLDADCNDPDSVAVALTDRARAITEFAASAPVNLLRETLATGEAFRDLLAHARIETRRDLDRMTKLSRGLASTLDQSQAERVTCFG